MANQYWKVSLEEEYKKNKDMKPTDVAAIHEWIKKQPHLPALTDLQIVMFLRACKMSLERTKDVIDLNYTMRTRLPELFGERDLSRKWLQTAMENMLLALMPEPDVEGNAVIVMKLKEIDLSNWSMEEYIKLGFMLHDLSNMMLGSMPGYNFIYDLQNLTFGLLLQCPISTTSNLLKYAQDASPCVIKGLHYVNGGSIIEKLFALINPFLNADVKKMIKVHPNYESLTNAIGKQGIPSDYGGTGPKLVDASEVTYKKLKEYQPWFDQEKSQRVDEKKRSKDQIKDYGIQGSFKKIDID